MNLNERNAEGRFNAGIVFPPYSGNRGPEGPAPAARLVELNREKVIPRDIRIRVDTPIPENEEPARLVENVAEKEVSLLLGGTGHEMPHDPLHKERGFRLDDLVVNRMH